MRNKTKHDRISVELVRTGDKYDMAMFSGPRDHVEFIEDVINLVMPWFNKMTRKADTRRATTGDSSKHREIFNTCRITSNDPRVNYNAKSKDVEHFFRRVATEYQRARIENSASSPRVTRRTVTLSRTRLERGKPWRMTSMLPFPCTGKKRETLKEQPLASDEIQQLFWLLCKNQKSTLFYNTLHEIGLRTRTGYIVSVEELPRQNNNEYGVAYLVQDCHQDLKIPVSRVELKLTVTADEARLQMSVLSRLSYPSFPCKHCSGTRFPPIDRRNKNYHP